METIDVTVDIDSGVGSAEATPVNLEQNPIVEETVQALELETSKPKTIIMTTTSKPAQIADADDDLSLDDVEDETLMERLVGLGEMFPEPLQNATSYALSTSKKAIKGGYYYLRHITFFVSTTSLLLLAPVLFEVERINTEEMMKQDRNKLVLGPGTAMSGSPSGLK